MVVFAVVRRLQTRAGRNDARGRLAAFHSSPHPAAVLGGNDPGQQRSGRRRLEPPVKGMGVTTTPLAGDSIGHAPCVSNTRAEARPFPPTSRLCETQPEADPLTLCGCNGHAGSTCAGPQATGEYKGDQYSPLSPLAPQPVQRVHLCCPGALSAGGRPQGPLRPLPRRVTAGQSPIGYVWAVFVTNIQATDGCSTGIAG